MNNVSLNREIVVQELGRAALSLREFRRLSLPPKTQTRAGVRGRTGLRRLDHEDRARSGCDSARYGIPVLPVDGRSQSQLVRDARPRTLGSLLLVALAQPWALPRGLISCPARSSVHSWRANSRSCSTMERTNSSKLISGCHPSTWRALHASPCRTLTSVGRK